MKERKISSAAGRSAEAVSVLVLQFLLYHCAACTAAGVFYDTEQPGYYAWFLLLAVPLCYLTLVRRLAKKFVIFLLLHLPVFFTAVLFGHNFGEKAVIAAATVLMTVFSLHICMMEKENRKECPSLGLGIVVLVCHFIGYYLDYPVLIKVSYYELLLYAVCYLLHESLKNTADFIHMNRDTANFPVGQMTVINRLMVILFMAVLAAAMYIFPHLHLEVLLAPILKGILVVLSWLLSFVHFSEASEKVDNTAQEMDMAAMLEALGGNKETGALWLLLEKILRLAVIIGLAVLILGVIAYILYRLYKGFYAEKKENTDEKEFLVGEIKWFPRGVFGGRKAAGAERGSIKQKIRKAFRQNIKKSFKKKETVPAAMTPEELLAFLKERTQQNDLDRKTTDRIREIYEQARYGQAECTQAELEEIKELLR